MFEAVTFGGGGTRCFWQGGFLSSVSEEIGLEPRRIDAVSGGTMSACVYVADLAERLLDIMTDRFERREWNIVPAAVTDDRDVIPHHSIYQEVIRETFDTAQAKEAVAEGPELVVHLARPIQLPGRFAAWCTAGIYEFDLYWRSSPHQRYARMCGARPLKVDARQAAREGKLVDLIVTAASVPPLFPQKRWEGIRVIDGGVIDNAPPPQCRDGETGLILLTRQYRRIPEHDGYVYACPSEEIPTGKADFSDADGVRCTWDLGCEDGHAFLKSLPRVN